MYIQYGAGISKDATGRHFRVQWYDQSLEIKEKGCLVSKCNLLNKIWQLTIDKNVGQHSDQDKDTCVKIPMKHQANCSPQ